MADKLTYHLARSTEGQVITVFVPGMPPKVADSTHPKFKAIRALLVDDAIDVDEFMAMFDSKPPLKAIGRQFEQLSDRVTAREGKLFFDGDEIHDSVANVILGLMTDGGRFMPVVRFMEKLYDNPNANSREQAYRWISSQKLTITENGDVVGYKGCRRRGDGVLESTTKGKAIVDGIEYTGYIPYPLGSVATMPRSEVIHDPGSACSIGLHVGTHRYAQTYGRNGAVVEVHVNPRDIVSVPKGEDEKMRVCRLRVVKENKAEYASTLRSTHAPAPPVAENEYAPPALDDEFADCVPCEVCGECKTHGECICEEAARQQTEVSADNAEKRPPHQNKVREAAKKWGFDWEPEWTEGPNPVATYGLFRVLEDDEDEGVFEDTEGILTVEVVGDEAYDNEHVAFYFAPEGTDASLLVEPDNVEYIGGPPSAAHPVVDESGLEPESIEDLGEDEVEEPVVTTIPRRFPTDEEFEDMKARAKRRRQNFIKYAQQTGGWTLVWVNGGSVAADWIVPGDERIGEADPMVTEALKDIPEEVDDSGSAQVKNPSRGEFAVMQAKSKTRRRPIRSLVNDSKSVTWTLIEGTDGTKREHWTV